MSETVVVIRTKNESSHIADVLGALSQQAYKNFEVVVVDSGSKDNTLEQVNSFVGKLNIKVLRIKPEDFSYPYALNYGIEQSNATKYVVIISGHSIPVSTTWLQDGIDSLNAGDKIAGVYGYMKPLPDGSFWDRVVMSYWGPFFRGKRTAIRHMSMGVLGFTNAIIRKDLWEQRKFNEAYGAGGEDGEWAGYWISKGYAVVRDSRFTVMHSHKLSLFGWYKQFKEWRSLGAPKKFSSLGFRKDGPHT